MKLEVSNLGKVAITVEEQPWNMQKAYDRLTIVEDNYMSYISRIPVPKGQPLTNNRKYWVPFSTRTAVKIFDFIILADIVQLPQTSDDYNGPYLIGDEAYFWVGENGNAVSGMYHKVTIKGEDGKSAYEIWCSHYDGDDLDEWTEERWVTEWLVGDKGDQGDNGKSAYELYCQQTISDGYEPMNLEDWLESLKGEEGKSAYALYVISCHAQNIHPLALEAWLASLKGAKGDKGDKGEPGVPGEPGANGQNGTDGKDGKNGRDGTNGKDGKDGVDGATPEIGQNGNWFINGQDTGKPSRGLPGVPGSGSSNNVYIDEVNKRLVFVVEPIDTEHVELFSPPVNGTILKIQSPSTYADVQVHGINITNPVIFESNDTNKFTLKYGDGTPSGLVRVPAEAANSDNIVAVRIIPNPSASTAMGFTGSVSIYSEIEEFEQRYISIQYINRVIPNNNGQGDMVGPGQGTSDSNQGNIEIIN